MSKRQQWLQRVSKFHNEVENDKRAAIESDSNNPDVILIHKSRLAIIAQSFTAGVLMTISAMLVFTGSTNEVTAEPTFIQRSANLERVADLRPAQMDEAEITCTVKDTAELLKL